MHKSPQISDTRQHLQQDPDQQGHGPSYHNTEVPYAIPNDAPEHMRLNGQHNVLVSMMHGQVTHAPLESPRRILDVGCGTGVVSCYLGRNFPNAEVLGVDLSPVPVSVDNVKPDNVTFCLGVMPEIACSGDDARFAADSFDFVFSRMLVGGMNKWQEYVTTAASLLSPGGLVEFQEIDTRFYNDGILCDEDWDWSKVFLTESVKRGLDPQCATNMEGYVRAAGLEVVSVKKFRWPYGDWLAKAGHPETSGAGQHMISPTIPMVKVQVGKMLEGSYSKDGIAELQAELTKVVEGTPRLYIPFIVTVGRKR